MLKIYGLIFLFKSEYGYLEMNLFDVCWVLFAQFSNGKIMTLWMNIKDLFFNRIDTFQDFWTKSIVYMYFALFIIAAEWFNFEDVFFNLFFEMDGLHGKIIKFYVGVMFMYYNKKVLGFTKQIFGQTTEEVLTKWKAMPVKKVEDEKASAPVVDNKDYKMVERRVCGILKTKSEDNKEVQSGSGSKRVSFSGSRGKRGIHSDMLQLKGNCPTF